MNSQDATDMEVSRYSFLVTDACEADYSLADRHRQQLARLLTERIGQGAGPTHTFSTIPCIFLAVEWRYREVVERFVCCSMPRSVAESPSFSRRRVENVYLSVCGVTSCSIPACRPAFFTICFAGRLVNRFQFLVMKSADVVASSGRASR